MKLFIWTISDTVVEHGTAIGFAKTREEAIEEICKKTSNHLRKELRQELQSLEPDIETDQPHGMFKVSPT
ncbi:MAG: hypothetical protein KME13_20460 [Myxacorys californica WJT36-NPBG1]|jgi:gamma-glutamylcysteine synthetase|nr:hypothetical protein [Myxacorys californica WJT36-NPBG1]